MDVERRRLPRHSRRPVGINGNRGLAILFVVLEAVSVLLDHVFGNSKWAPLAAFLLSVFGFAINIYACFLERRRRRRRGRRRRGSSNSIDDAIRSHSDRQLEIVEIVFSALQFIATLIHFILMISNVKSNYNVSVILPLAFAIIAVIFVFRKEENIENSLLEKKLEKMIDSFSNALGTASTGIRQLCQKLKGLASFKSAASRALKCLKFICEIDGGAGWSNVEKRFYEITAATNGVLPRARFGECIGMSEDSKGFSVKLFDAFARRRGIHGDTVTKDQIREFWDRINNKSLDSRLRTFFDMVDKDGNDRITEDEIREIICVNASANKFLNTQKKAEAFAAGIMEELDPDYLGYITINDLKVRLGFDSYPV